MNTETVTAAVTTVHPGPGAWRTLDIRIQSTHQWHLRQGSTTEHYNPDAEMVIYKIEDADLEAVILGCAKGLSDGALELMLAGLIAKRQESQVSA